MPRKKGTFDKKAYDLAYEANNTTRVSIKLNNGTDADILAHLDVVGNKQGYIKTLIRQDMLRYNKSGGES